MRKSTLPVLGVLTVIAVAGGLQLGETAVAQIDPLYFEGAAPPARDVTRNGAPVYRNDYTAASGWAERQVARAVDCGADCPPTGADRAFQRLDEPLGPYSDPTIEPRWERASAEPRPGQAATDDEVPRAQSRVARYLDYPIDSAQAEARVEQAERSAAEGY